jgi:hypothetical protein
MIPAAVDTSTLTATVDGQPVDATAFRFQSPAYTITAVDGAATTEHRPRPTSRPTRPPLRPTSVRREPSVLGVHFRLAERSADSADPDRHVPLLPAVETFLVAAVAVRVAMSPPPVPKMQSTGPPAAPTFFLSRFAML